MHDTLFNLESVLKTFYRRRCLFKMPSPVTQRRRRSGKGKLNLRRALVQYARESRQNRGLVIVKVAVMAGRGMIRRVLGRSIGGFYPPRVIVLEQLSEGGVLRNKFLHPEQGLAVGPEQRNPFLFLKGVRYQIK